MSKEYNEPVYQSERPPAPPLPPRTVQSVKYTRDNLKQLTNRDVNDALSELYDRFNYYFATTDGEFDLPAHDGATHQLLKMIGEVVIKHKDTR